MTAKQVYQGTMPFSMAKLALGAVTIVLSAVLFAILMGIGWLFGGGGTGIAIVIWVGGTGVIRFVIMHYMGYLVKAGHVAVIAEAITTGEIPANQVGYGKKIVAERFATSNIYFAVDKLMTGAVKQIQRGGWRGDLRAELENPAQECRQDHGEGGRTADPNCAGGIHSCWTAVQTATLESTGGLSAGMSYRMGSKVRFCGQLHSLPNDDQLHGGSSHHTDCLRSLQQTQRIVLPLQRAV